MKRKLLYIIMILILICIVPIKAFAATEIDDVINDGDNFLSHADSVETKINTSKLGEISGDIYNIALAAGMVIAVIVGLILGIQFMISTVEEKAKIKEILIIYIIGCIVLVASFTIWKVVMVILGNV